MPLYTEELQSLETPIDVMFLMHKVHPIIKGTRCSVVSWLSGDSWK